MLLEGRRSRTGSSTATREFRWGQSAQTMARQGLSKSEFAVVILSPSFVAEKWANPELDCLFALTKLGQKRIPSDFSGTR